MDNKKVRELIVLVLELNPEPADEQVHALASALGIDHESLEATIYKMMGEVIADDDLLVEAADEDVVNELNIDPDTLSNGDVAMNDGDPTDDDTGYQEETTTDGADVNDEGVGMNSDVDILTDDGSLLPPEV